VHANTFPGWFTEGHTVDLPRSGKYDAYDAVSASVFRFVIGGATAVLTLQYETTMVDFVRNAGLSTSSRNIASTIWSNGHGSFPWESRNSNSVFPSATLRLGVGDGAGEPEDWAVFMFEAGNGNGDFNGFNVRAVGSEQKTFSGWAQPGVCVNIAEAACTVEIYAEVFATPPKPPSPPAPQPSLQAAATGRAPRRTKKQKRA